MIAVRKFFISALSASGAFVSPSAQANLGVVSIVGFIMVHFVFDPFEGSWTGRFESLGLFVSFLTYWAGSWFSASFSGAVNTIFAVMTVGVNVFFTAYILSAFFRQLRKENSGTLQRLSKIGAGFKKKNSSITPVQHVPGSPTTKNHAVKSDEENEVNPKAEKILSAEPTTKKELTRDEKDMLWIRGSTQGGSHFF